MTITCNGEQRIIAPGTTLVDLVLDLGLEPDFVVVEYNGRILERSEYDSQTLEDEAVIELIRFVGGG